MRIAIPAAVLVSWLAAGAAAQEGSDTKTRIRAIRDLIPDGSKAIPRLEPYLADPSVDVRRETVKALTEIGTQRSLDPLIRATRDADAEIQIRATDGLVNFYLPGYVERGISATLKRAGQSIIGRFSDQNTDVVPSYVEARPEVVDALGKLSRGGLGMDVRANAARAVGILRGRAAVPDLLEALRTKDDRVLYESLIAIQKIRDPESAAGIAFLLNDLNEKIQILAIETTGLLLNRSALPQLREVLTRARSRNVSRAALGAIAMMPDESSRYLFEHYFADKDDGIRAAAAEGYARLKNPADLPALERAFSAESKTSPRLSLAFAIVMLGKRELADGGALEYLVRTLESRSWRGVAQAFLLEVSRDPEVRRTLYPVLRTGKKEQLIQLAPILAASGAADTVAPLEQLSQHPDADVAAEALRALRSLKTRLR